MHYNVTLKRVRVTTVDVDKQYYIFCVCVRILTLVIRHAPYYIVNCDIYGSTIFSQITHKRHNFRGCTEYKSVLSFSLKLCMKHSHSKKNSARYCHKCTQLNKDRPT